MKIAVIGCGSIGRRHIANLLAMGKREIGVYDANMDASSAVCTAERGEAVGLFGDMEDLWDWKPEAVLICTPPDSHFDLAYEAAWQECKALFIEKPLSLDLIGNGAGWMRFLMPPWEPLTMVGCNWRFHPGPLALKRWLDEGAIGDVLSARISMGYYLPDTKQNYQNSYAATTGVTLDIGSHAVDLALWLLGPARLCSAVVRSAESIGLKGAEGLAELLLEHKSGAVSSVRVSWLQRDRHTIQIVGTKAVAEWKDGSGVILSIPHRAEEIYPTYDDVDVNQMYVDEIAHFLTCVRENRPTCNPVSSAVDVLKILLEARQCGR